jgi:hypothetical protein
MEVMLMKKRIPSHAKRTLGVALATLMLTTLMFMLSGCGAKLAGTFVNPDDSTNYIVFDGKTFILYESGAQVHNGTFTESAKSSSGQYSLRLYYEGESVDERYWLNEDKSIINYTIPETTDGGTVMHVGEVAFIKEG